MNKIIAIIGPTSSGKSELAVKIAKHFHGEIISVDSRQVYRGMDLGTGKIPGKWHTLLVRGREKSTYVYKQIPHHLIDFQNPAQQLSAARFKVLAQKKIREIVARGRLPILCGGTMHWMDAVIYNQNFPEVKPNPKLRRELEKKPAADLFAQLKKLDPRRAASIDPFNKRRLIRALEIVITTGKSVPALDARPSTLDALIIGINPPRPDLYKKIERRLRARIKQGMIKEVDRLHKNGLSWKKLESFGLEYKFVSLFLQNKISREEMFGQLFTAIKQYTKRQMTWWKRNKEIVWVDNADKTRLLVADFLKK